MKNIRPCPYCGGEVEVIKLVKRKNEIGPVYRIECMKCRKLVARGKKFDIESEDAGKKRIKEYNEVQRKLLYPNSAPALD